MDEFLYDRVTELREVRDMAERALAVSLAANPDRTAAVNRECRFLLDRVGQMLAKAEREHDEF